MHADVARKTLELLGEAQELAHLLLGGFALVEQRLGFTRVNGILGSGRAAALERDRFPRLKRDEFGNAVAKGIRKVQHAPDIAHDGSRRQRAESGDLRYRFRAVFLLDVVDDPIATVLAEVDVEIGHGYALGIQEALEEQRVTQGVEVGDL